MIVYFVHQGKINRKKANINPEFMERILKDAYNEGVREVGYFTSGEPFLNNNLAKYIKLAKDIGFRYVYLTSNGSIANIDRVKECIEAGLNSLRFSINAHNRELYKFIHGKDDFDTVIKNLKDVSEYKNNNNFDFKLYTSTILTSYTNESKEELQKLLRKYVDDMVFMNVRNGGGMISGTIDRLYVDNDRSKQFQCVAPFNAINITCEGYLNVCCTDRDNYLAIADLNTMTLREAWESEIFVEFRKKFINRNVKGTLCENCLNDTCNKVYPLNEELNTMIDFIDLDNDYKELENRLKSIQ